MTQSSFQIISAQTSDSKLVLDFLSTAPFYFRHLDWHLPVDWLGTQPYYICSYQNQTVALLICPYINDPFVWIRCFAGHALHSTQEAWNQLLQTSIIDLQKLGATALYSIALQDWYRELLFSSGFMEDNQIVVLENKLQQSPYLIEPVDGFHLTQMQPLELEEVWKLDQTCFGSLWQMSREDIMTAFRVSENCTTVRNDAHRLIGYQISNTMPSGGHLARIAVHPSFRGKRIGQLLLSGLLERFRQKSVLKVTVNTQADNTTAISLYEKNGFVLTGETYPVYRLDI
jgi:[ribosomal protein S18]-alanine N-acetyltransferase